MFSNFSSYYSVFQNYGYDVFVFIKIEITMISIIFIYFIYLIQKDEIIF